MKRGNIDKNEQLDNGDINKVKDDEYLKCPLESKEDTLYGKKFIPPSIEPVSTEVEEKLYKVEITQFFCIISCL